MEITETATVTETQDIMAKIATEYTQFDNCVTYARLSSELSNRINELGSHTVKIESLIFLLIAKGTIKLNYNFSEYEVPAPALLSFAPGSVIYIDSQDLASTDIYILAYKPSFLQEVNISINAISGEALLKPKSPVLNLTDNELSLMLRYFSLIHTILADNFSTQLTKHIVSSITSALFYQGMLILYKHIDTTDTETMGTRRSNYVHDFIKLVHLYYTKERSVGFYASKLFISPKYLSLLVKEATGRSAAQWIDRFVIVEAKNLLRYSGKNIQQVAYELNFSNQSSFGKYFKHLTGMSPTEFQKS